jgi:hypothetical protein
MRNVLHLLLLSVLLASCHRGYNDELLQQPQGTSTVKVMVTVPLVTMAAYTPATRSEDTRHSFSFASPIVLCRIVHIIAVFCLYFG